MTLKHLEDFRAQIRAQLARQELLAPAPGQELMKHVGLIELHVGLNLVSQLITMEQALLAAPPGPVGPEI